MSREIETKGPKTRKMNKCHTTKGKEKKDKVKRKEKKGRCRRRKKSWCRMQMQKKIGTRRPQNLHPHQPHSRSLLFHPHVLMEQLDRCHCVVGLVTSKCSRPWQYGCVPKGRCLALATCMESVGWFETEMEEELCHGLRRST